MWISLITSNKFAYRATYGILAKQSLLQRRSRSQAYYNDDIPVAQTEIDEAEKICLSYANCISLSTFYNFWWRKCRIRQVKNMKRVVRVRYTLVGTNRNMATSTVIVGEFSNDVRRWTVEEVPIPPKKVVFQRRCPPKSSTRRGTTWFQAILRTVKGSAHSHTFASATMVKTQVSTEIWKIWKACQTASKLVTFFLTETVFPEDDVSEKGDKERRYREHMFCFSYAFFE